MRQRRMKTFERCLASQLCLVQQYFDGTDYLQAARSLLKIGREEEGPPQKCLKILQGGTGFGKGSTNLL